ncbi:urea ABC transporter permease subunit UrtB [Methylococcus sp. EFPC2]|uniref:urea ABC transporter permease subunit UrtB n=1 Tax=Methylococcus sp. EFPC2 TaxID=2812648 RepID=UPI001966D8B6|nr:urea ABC transporter permease subunit UrtB [Methylococcus sp. EFPC2]QSA97419.1 urea ABC transporter permease subunit UrtB [Methylococcus sp. EFPC2]
MLLLTTRMRRWLAGLLWALSLHAAHAVPVEAPELTAALTRLKDAPLAELGDAVQVVAAIRDDRVPGLLKALLEGRLYAVKADGRVVYATPADEGYAVSDALSGQSLGSKGRFEVKKIAINNTVRNSLNGLIARLELSVDDPAQRLKAVEAMSQSADAAAIELLRKQFEVEADPKVRGALVLALALADIAGADKEKRLVAIRSLEGTLDQEARNRLNALVEKDDEGEYLESDEDIRNAALAVIKHIEFELQLNRLAETLFFGLSLGAVLVLAGIGLAITFGVMGVINMAHGELMMIGAYTTYVVQRLLPDHLDVSLFVAIPAAFLISGLVGIAIERGIIRFLYGRPLETLLATFGVSLFLQQSVRSIFSPLNRSVSTPAWMSGSVEINHALAFTLNRFYIVVFSLLVFVALLAILKRTRLGLEVRAVAQNRSMARAMGIPTDRVDALTFGLGSGIAGVAGVALSQLTNVGPNLGQSYIVDSFMVVVFGGVGNLWGTLVGGMSLGLVNKLLEPYAGAVLAKIIILVFIILFIQKKPRGLFPQKGRAAEG